MTPVIILTIVCTLLVLLLIIASVMIFSYKRELKTYYFLETLEESIRRATDAIREFADEERQRDITLNIEHLIKNYSPISPSVTSKEDLSNLVIESLLKVLSDSIVSTK